MTRNKTTTLFRGFALALVLLLAASCNQTPQDTTEIERSVAVKAMVVRASDRQVTRSYTGSLEGAQQAVLRARLAEAVKEVRALEGQRVNSDDIIIALDKYGPSSQYAQTVSQYQNAKKNFEKMEFLFGEGATSESKFDAARTEYEVFKAQFEAISRQVEIHTPIGGTVTSIRVAPGDLVHVGQELATVATTDRLRVKFGVNADDISFFKVGADVVISNDAVEGSAMGQVTAIASSADPVARSFQVEALINNAEGGFNPGMFVHIDYILQRLTDVIAVPSDAILILDDQETIFTSVAGQAEMHRVTVGDDLSGDIVITSGLSSGDTLITLGQDYLEDGVTLNITELSEQN